MGNGCEEDLGELGGGETIIRMYCMKKYIFFNKRKDAKKEDISVPFVLENYLHIP